MITLRKIVFIAAFVVLSLGVPAVSQAFQIVPAQCTIDGGVGCSICDIILVITNAANIMAGTLSGVSLVMFIAGGMMLIFSAGNEERIQAGKKILTSTVVGLIIVFLAWSIIGFVVRIAYSSNVGTDYRAGVDPSLFGNENWKWWKPPTCTPPAPAKSCKGLSIADACTTSEGGRGFCYREKLTAQGNDCLVDVKLDIAKSSDAAFVDSNTSASKGGCACTNSCELLGKTDRYVSGDKSKVQVSCILKDVFDARSQSELPYACEIGGEPGVCIERAK